MLGLSPSSGTSSILMTAFDIIAAFIDIRLDLLRLLRLDPDNARVLESLLLLLLKHGLHQVKVVRPLAIK